MKKVLFASVATAAIGALALVQTGCDWSSGGATNSFNTSQGAGININFSGFYRGELNDGKAVDRPSAGKITTFTMTQVGNRLDAIDNQGSRYSGSVGSPGLVSQPVNGVYPAGAELVQSQVSFSGRDIVSGKDIEFVGIVHVVSVIDIEQEIESSSETETSTDTRTDTIVNVGQDTTETITVVTIGTPGDPFYSQSTTTVVTDNQTGEEISRTTTRTGSETSSSFDGYQITEANSQYRLEGTWIETYGNVSTVQARSAGSAGLIQVVDEDEDTDFEDDPNEE